MTGASAMVTFLLTDIEGSTELWERQPAAMGEALAHHDAMAASVVAAGGGRLVKTRGEGDATFSVFDSPAAAVVAATELQSPFANETFPGGIDLRIRIALHTGIAENRAGDFFGRVVNRCARLRSAAHGRQTVCSRTTADLVVDDLPETVWLRDLGEYQLKGLERAEQVFQVCWSGGADSFPPLRTITPPRHNLPVRRTRFLGRDKQLHEVGDLIGDRQLVTIVGANGCGKTRLAIEVGERILPAFPDGVWLVELAALADPAGVVAAVGAVLSLRESAPSLLDRLRALLADKHLLL